MVAATAAMALGIGGAAACGCGALLHASEVSEKALVTLHAGRETIVPGLTIDRVGDHAAVVFPVPARPRIRALPKTLNLFHQLERATATHSVSGGGGRGAPTAGARPPSVVSKKVIGGYEVTVLRGGTRETVLAWLSSHHYLLPAAAGPILAGYIAKRWYFVAIRLSGRSAGQIKPLAIAFRSRRIVYPMKLSRAATEPVDLELFLNSDTPLAVHGWAALRTTFRGTVASARFSKAVQALLPASYLTRVEVTGGRPHTIRSDIWAVPRG
jgi:hypothetical protein